MVCMYLEWLVACSECNSICLSMYTCPQCRLKEDGFLCVSLLHHFLTSSNCNGIIVCLITSHYSDWQSLSRSQVCRKHYAWVCAWVRGRYQQENRCMFAHVCVHLSVNCEKMRWEAWKGYIDLRQSGLSSGGNYCQGQPSLQEKQSHHASCKTLL